ncbi:5-bromo-4-chloroindolyl phosphate hydrolysis family protein [Vagococcus carniphilus]|uniref:5-bromo-4-chloroindolyl phosphate hydrolysis family protein n=1 Tax=Vagococcus carniphilus TaxID=218144 RepID=A0A430AWC4_9ENTE|nr:5-bromo-4-chloroindolyl phosphate hydrolysis family protein [Vagococcus carniphilus]MDT2815142.1 5-bromo-4-chloroindolyl phosphate hydrolysis family protein [Vagococcus carniphilus]MDT2831628.1 5-bromo-4-chloroindolyl phosphate hydrolysis family protein [Vagococcus carniphilus]MDT2834054.1 5-bromo-4-chloroindolyl phosphate hydrolysis family protein [Vagococcus carniphilus]MDT2840464.1 5-bromo-4-chloroindolyl phosphate hydrolysis family protein [Vagococcus carniphilus]MDT2849898.1 5-bromo-4-
MKQNNSKLYKVLLVIIILIPLNIFVGSNHYLLGKLIAGALSLSLVIAVYWFIKAIASKNKKSDNNIPYLTKEKEEHYADFGMNDQEIAFFRDTMAQAKKNIATLEENMNQVAKLKAINLRYDTLKATKAMFKEIVKEPNKLHQSDQFLYNHLPNLVELTNKYVEINNHELKNKNTFEVLNQSAVAIEEVSQLIVNDYSDFVKDDLEDLDVEISIAKQNINREKELEEYKQQKEQI